MVGLTEPDGIPGALDCGSLGGHALAAVLGGDGGTVCAIFPIVSQAKEGR